MKNRKGLKRNAETTTRKIRFRYAGERVRHQHVLQSDLVDVVNITLLGTSAGMRQYASLESRQWMRGATSVWALLLIPAVLLVLLAATFVFFEGRKAYWDYRVREMCAKDGGVKTNEIIDVDAGQGLRTRPS